jgi:putative membrane protein
MIIELKIPWKRILNDLKYVMLFIVIYMIGFSVIDFYYPLQSLHIPIALITVPGTVIALLLGFRTNSAYDRWWEARIIWGAIVNDSRSWVRQLLTFVDFGGHSSIEFGHIRKMAMRQIAWNYALTGHLRKLDTTSSFQDWLEDTEMRAIKTKTNVPNALLYNQGQDLKKLRDSQLIDQYQFVCLDNTLTRFTDSMGKCERIKNTVFPTSYSLLVDTLIYMWILFLPFGLIENIGLILIPTAVSLAFSFLAIDRIAYYMQDPFDNLPSDTPMFALSRAIEINILEELGEKSIPDPVQSVDGVLM